MENTKLDELIYLTARYAAYMDGQNNGFDATKKELNISEAMRAFFKMDRDRVSELLKKYNYGPRHLVELEDKDPITKILAKWTAYTVTFEEKEDDRSTSRKEYVYIKKIEDSIRIKVEDDDISYLAFGLVSKISNPEFLIDNDLLNKIELEKADGVIYTRRIQPLLKAFFNSLEKNNLYDTWEENYLALIKYKSELQDMFGKMDLKEFETRYKELKPLISNQKKEKIAKEKQLAKELADKEKQIAKEKAAKEKQLAKDLAAKEKQIAKEKAAKEKQLAKDLAAKEKQLAKEKATKEKQLAKEKAELQKNKTHEYSVSNGIHYCKYCGGDEKWRQFDCKRELGHKYTLRRVQNKFGFDYSFQPVCNNCGDIRHYCQPDNKYEFKCEIN